MYRADLPSGPVHPMKHRLAVIMMADMVDYTRLMEVDQDGTIGLVG